MANVRISKSLGAPDVERCIRPDGSVDGKALRDVLRFFLREVDMNRRETYNDLASVNDNLDQLQQAIDSIATVSTDVPILSGVNIRASVGGLIQWDAGTITYKDIVYTLTAGTLDNTYAYWQVGDTALTGKDEILVSDLSPDRFWLCQRIAGEVYPTPISPITIAGLSQSGTIYTNHAYAGNLIVGSRTGLTSGIGMYSNGANGDWSVGDGTNAYISFDADGGSGGNGRITLGGDVIIPASGGTGNVTYSQASVPTDPETGDLWHNTGNNSLSRYNGSLWIKVSDVTANYTSNDTSHVNGVSSSTVSTNSGYAGSHLNSTGLRTVIKASNLTSGSVSDAGLYMNKTYIGYYNGSAWRSYFDSSGNCYFGDGGTTIGTNKFINWNGSDIVISADSGWIGSTTNYFDIDNGKLHLAGTGGAIEIGGKTSYSDTDAGVWIGMDSGTAKVNIGDSSNFWKWDGNSVTTTSSSTSVERVLTIYEGEINSSSENSPYADLLVQYVKISDGKILLDHVWNPTETYEDTQAYFDANEIYLKVGNTTYFRAKSFIDSTYSIIIGDTASADALFVRITDTEVELPNATLGYRTNSGSFSDDLKVLMHTGFGDPSWQGRAILAYGSIDSSGGKITGSDTGSITWSVSAGSGTGYYTLTIDSGTGNWIVIPAVNRYSSGISLVINPSMNSSGFFDNGTTDNIYMEGTGGAAQNKEWYFHAIRIS